MDSFPLIMIGAMYENGGNTTHRFLDGHPELFVYPFESQLGTRLVVDYLASAFPAKYRWPVFRLGATPGENFQAIIDEECRVRANTPSVSKFRHFPFDFSDAERAERFSELVSSGTPSRCENVHAFFRATMLSWHDRQARAENPVYVGYSPIITVDAGIILQEVPAAHFVHVVRNPWSAYSETKRRPVPLPLDHYLFGWLTVQLAALRLAPAFPDRFHVLRFEDLVRDPTASLGAICERIGLSASPSLAKPSWNGTALSQVYPWGTIRKPTDEENRATAAGLSGEEKAIIASYTEPVLASLDYSGFLASA
ncbi:MAG TPA: sulfotransferase [Candidatus Dormibacteraeota bacterium]|nr:sulfotransferase [Candidatus Dormibacteraeota bacterium]